MAAVASVSFASIAQSTDWKFPIPPSHRCFPSNLLSQAPLARWLLRIPEPEFGGSLPILRGRKLVNKCLRFKCFFTYTVVDALRSKGTMCLDFVSQLVNSETSCGCCSDPPTVAHTKLNFLKAYKRPIPSIYNTVLQELIVQQHLTRYKKSYQYDPVFALGFVTVYDQLMEGYPSNEDREAIFKAYVEALNEDPAQYRVDAQKVEEWARSQSATTLVDFASREGEVEDVLKGIAERAGSKGSFSYSRFFAVGLFRLLELSNATEPTILDKLCAALNVDKKSVECDLDVYRNLLSKLVQAKELLREYVDREKKKIEERAATQKVSEAVKTMLGVGGVTS